MRKPLLVLIIVLFAAFGKVIKTNPYPFSKLLYFPEMPQSSENKVTVEGALLGKYLFYDSVLSADSTISCSSCHKQQYAFSDSARVFSRGINGASMKRNTLALFNLAWYPQLFWDGRASSIEAQVFHPLRAADEMKINWKKSIRALQKSKIYPPLFLAAFGSTKIDSSKIGKALAQFLRTLISNQSKYDRVIAGKDRFTKDELEGFILVNEQSKAACLVCHPTDANALGTNLGFSNNGLDAISDPEKYSDAGVGTISGNKSDYGKFKIPSLRNIAFTAPYMHDGRFSTLEQVIEFYSSGVKTAINLDSKMMYAHQGGAKLTMEEQQKVIAYLHTLSDSAFIQNPEFSNPFQ